MPCSRAFFHVLCSGLGSLENYVALFLRASVSLNSLFEVFYFSLLNGFERLVVLIIKKLSYLK